ncbi:MAG: riboflavin synthase [Synechococcus sp.]
MFTGLIQAVGTIQRRSSGVLVDGCGPFAPLAIGDSVAVDGVCLTVAERAGEGFLADVSEETLSRTTLGWKADRGAAVNLEPALRLSDRLGGHLVSGHVDAIGEVVAIESRPQSWELQLRWLEPRFGRYVCEKASIAVDGISLTVARCASDGVDFTLAVIPHTWAVTTLQKRAIGDRINLEADQLARYAERLLDGSGDPGARTAAEPCLSQEWLAAHGWS